MTTAAVPVPSRSALVVALLSLAIVVTALLSWEAVASARRARDTAEGVLRDYAALAADQFVREAESRLEAQIAAGLDSVRFASHRDDPLMPRRLPASANCQCAPPVTASTLFILSTEGLLFEKGTRLQPALIGELTADLENPGNRRPHMRLIADGVVVTQVQMIGGAPALAGFVAKPDFLSTVFQKVVEDGVLLPSTLADRAAVREALAIRVVDDVRRVWFSVRDGESPYRGAADFAARFGRLRVEAAIPPALAPALIIGGLPAARWPLAIGLLFLAVGLGVAAVIQLRREIRFARARADFVSSVSHELRTPLAQIRLFGETLQLGRVRSRDEERRAADVIVQEAQRLTQMVDNVLMFSRTTRGHRTLRREPEELAVLVTDIVDSFRPQAASKETRVVLNDAGLQGVAAVDRQAVRQILLNLLDNAVKYGPRGQTVQVEAASTDQTLQVVVDDEGPGIPLGQRSRLWEPFWRGSGSAEGGTGLGLAIVRELVTAHGGSVSVEDGTRGGARFIVTLATGDHVSSSALPSADPSRAAV